MKILLTTFNNSRGYLQGFYNFQNFNNRLFYRSSWELKVFQTLDFLKISNPHLKFIDAPKGLLYTLDDKIHRYFPDLEIFLDNNKSITFEIKPKSQLLLEMNVAKFAEANKVLENFIVITEDEIFDTEFDIILEKKIKDIYNGN